MKATSLNSDSNATAATMPSWRSVISIWRVPNRMAKTISNNATKNVVSIQNGWYAGKAGVATSGYRRNRLKLVEIAFN